MSLQSIKQGLQLLQCPLTSDSNASESLTEALSTPGSESRLRLIEWLIRRYDADLLDRVGEMPLQARGTAARPPSISQRTQQLSNGAHVLGLCSTHDYDAVEGRGNDGNNLIAALIELVQAQSAAVDAEVVGGVTIDQQSNAAVDLLHRVGNKQRSIFSETASFVLPTKKKATSTPNLNALSDRLANYTWELSKVTSTLDAMDKLSIDAQTRQDISSNICETWRQIAALVQQFNQVYVAEIEPWTHVNPPEAVPLGGTGSHVLSRYEHMHSILESLTKIMDAYTSMKGNSQAAVLLASPEFGDSVLHQMKEYTQVLETAAKRARL